MNNAALRETPTWDSHIEWSAEKPYAKTSFLSHINRDTEDKPRWLYTFSGYVDGIYEQAEQSYVNVAQKNTTGSFVPLWPGMSTPTNSPIIEISKREKSGKMPKDNESADKLDPSILISYKWHTITIPLENVLFQSNQWFDVLDKIYKDIETHTKKYETIGEEEGKEIHDFVIKILQEKKYLKAKLGEKAKKTTWSMSGRLLDVFKWLLGSNTERN